MSARQPGSRHWHTPAPLRQAAALPGLSTLVLRAFLGVTFIVAGLQKLASQSFFDQSAPGSIQEQLAGAIHTSPIRALLHVVAHAPVAFGIVIAIAELAIGVGALFGLLTRVAAAGGMLLSLMLFLSVSYTTWPYYLGSDIVFLFAWTPLLIGGAPVFSIDARLAEEDARDARDARVSSERAQGIDATGPAALDALERRAVLRRASAAMLAVFGTAVGAGIVAGLGRAFTPGARSVLSSATPTTPPATRATTGSASSTLPARARLIGHTSEVPVRGALFFTDPAQDIPAYALQPTAGSYIAFSAVCTHAGCTVGFDRADERFVCPCHGSEFNAITGAVIQGPALLPLPRIDIVEHDGDLYATD
jgi:thiosulfate dehydrogenase (quinone) large subunit